MPRERYTLVDRWREFRRDDGALIPIVAISIVVLLAFTGFAVDVGMLYAERRQEQSAVDAGSLAAGLSTDAGNPLDDEEQIVDDILEYTRLNMIDPPTPDDWRDAFEDCTDPGRTAAGYTHTATADGDTFDCISFNGPENDRDQMRVLLPTTEIDTIFASLVGVDTFVSNALAEVAVTPGRVPFGGTLPYGVPTGVASDTTLCVKSDSNANNKGCGGQGSNHGRLDLSVFGTGSIPQQCGNNANADERTAINTAAGLDHLLSEYGGGTIYYDEDVCNGSQTLPADVDGPNGGWFQTGTTSNGVDSGLLSTNVCTDYNGVCQSGGSEPGRLTRVPPSGTAGHSPWNTAQAQTGRLAIDDNPLWEFLGDDLDAGSDADTEVPVACYPDLYANHGNQSTAQTVLQSAGLSAAEAASTAVQYKDAYGQLNTSNARTWNFESADLMRKCFDDYKAGGYTTDMFTLDSDGDGVYDVEYSPRFAWVPQISDEALPNGNKSTEFVDFLPVFVQSTYWRCNTQRCAIVHNPGEPLIRDNVPNGQTCACPNVKAEAFTALNFPAQALPAAVTDNRQGTVSDTSVELIR